MSNNKLKSYVRKAKEVYVGVPVGGDVHYVRVVKGDLLAQWDTFYDSDLFADYSDGILYLN